MKTAAQAKPAPSRNRRAGQRFRAPVETEIKLTLAPGDMEKLLHHRLLASRATGRPRTRNLLNIYYDTPDLRLRRARITLRLRRCGKRWIQTIKTPGRAVGGLHERPEWEVATAAGTLMLDDLPEGEIRRAFSDPALRAALQPAFTVEFKRILVALQWSGGDAVELAFDRGRIQADGGAQMLCELELELKAGARERLFSLARSLHRSAPLLLSNVSKAERGYRLVTGEALTPARARPPARNDAAGAGGLCRSVLAAGLAHLQANEEGVRLTDDPGFVHQARVAARRLRSALKAFAPLLPAGRLELWQDELRWLGRALNGARDWDVFVGGTLAAIRSALPQEPALEWLSSRSIAEQARQRKTAREALDSRRCQGLLLDLGGWLATPRWRDGAATATPAAQFGAAVLTGRHRKLNKRAHELDRRSAEALHRVRIAVKELRYVAECFAPRFERKRAACYIGALRDLQDVLGELNDEATAAALMQQLSPRAGGASRQRACGLVLGWASGLSRKRLPAVRKAWKRFAEHKPFWPYRIGKTPGSADGGAGETA